MPPTVVLPTPKDVRDTLADLLGRDVDVAPCEAVVPSNEAPCTLAVFVDDAMTMSCVGVLDLPLSAWVGAAIGLVPAGGAADCVEVGELTPMVRDNLYEVLNVLSATLNKPGASHQKLYAMHEPGSLPPTDVSSWAKVVVGRIDLAVTVAGYGSGRLGFVSCV
ncbi:MAG TPA: hypothetical protein VLC50_02685 [Actinomycetes bacterium]|nr:hypothetical protein [Actinomycetes bacterium]